MSTQDFGLVVQQHLANGALAVELATWTQRDNRGEGQCRPWTRSAYAEYRYWQHPTGLTKD